MLRAVGRPADMVRVLAQSGVAASVTGTTNETTLATITLPGGAMGINGGVRIHTLWSMTNNANNKTQKVKFGGTSILFYTLTSVAGNQTLTIYRNRGAANSQVGLANSSTGIGNTSSAPTTSSIDTSADVTILITGQLATGTDTLTLEAYSVEVLPA